MHFNGLNPFDISVKYCELNSYAPENVHDYHIHNECEIYINLSGDVSFSVENHIYPVKPGDIIITRPFEYHHCTYHSNKLHKHFWILFSADGNEELFDVFFKRKSGEGNQLTLSPEGTEELISLCHKMVEPPKSEAEMYYRFFKLITLLSSADVANVSVSGYPQCVLYAMNYIGNNFDKYISVADIAKGANVSVNTLERHFLKVLNCTPSEYIKKKRLANAAKLLTKGFSVTETSEKSGFSDYSYFISIFKKTYGVTPLKYRKSIR